MSNPVIEAFFFGRALAEVINEKIESSLTNALSEIGKFDAEQRKNLQKFTEEVKVRAQQYSGQASTTDNSSNSTGYSSSPQSSGDLQETIDDLRAEIARLRVELKKYRQ